MFILINFIDLQEEYMTVETKKRRLGWVLAVYLLGIFIGAIDTGILTPARIVVQNSLGVGEKTGIWMITAFTLAYACAMPILGKLADRMGRKKVYMVAIALFGTGSLICGLSNFVDSFPLLIVGRVIQAIGGGGIVPLATAEFGTSFPENKRGMALGLVGGVYGIANILGATLGSAILDLVGTANWHWLFFINLPICVFVVAVGIFTLPKGEKKSAHRIDYIGTVVLVVMVLSLLYGLNNLDFFDFGKTIGNADVYPFLILFALLVPLFVRLERRSADPIFNIGYFSNGRIVITFVLALAVGIMLMGMVFVPQFAENALKTRAGSGGYFVTILGLFAGIGGPLSGRLVDKFGPKKILFLGFGISMVAALFLALYATSHVSVVSVVVSLILMGSGLGFVMGTPLNYMMLSNTPKEESNSALSALSLIRSIGTTIGPIIMIGFIAQAGTAAQDKIMNVLPPISSIQITADETLTEGITANLNSLKEGMTLSDEKQDALLTIVDELETQNAALKEADAKMQADFESIKNDPDFADMLAEMDFSMSEGADTPDFSSIRDMLSQNSGMSTDDIDEYMSMLDFENQAGMDFDMTGDGELPEDVLQRLQSSDVNSITGDVVYLTERMFNIYTPDVIVSIQSGIGEGISGIGEGISGLTKASDGIATGLDGLNSGIDGIGQGIEGAQQGLSGMSEGMDGMNSAVSGIKKGIKGISSGITQMEEATKGIAEGIAGMEQGIAGLDAQIAAKQAELQASIAAGDPPPVFGKMQGELIGLTAAHDSLQAKMEGAQSQRGELESQIASMKKKVSSMKASIKNIKAAKEKLAVLIADVQEEVALMTSMQTGMSNAAGIMEEQKSTVTHMSAQMLDVQKRLETLQASMPGYFDTALDNYVMQVESQGDEIETVFQSTLNAGFTRMYYAVAILCAAACIALVFYRNGKRKTEVKSQT